MRPNALQATVFNRRRRVCRVQRNYSARSDKLGRASSNFIILCFKLLKHFQGFVQNLKRGNALPNHVQLKATFLKLGVTRKQHKKAAFQVDNGLGWKVPRGRGLLGFPTQMNLVP